MGNLLILGSIATWVLFGFGLVALWVPVVVTAALVALLVVTTVFALVAFFITNKALNGVDNAVRVRSNETNRVTRR